jgi:hypothetical protein
MAEEQAIAYIIRHITSGEKYLLKVLNDYISISIDGVEYRSYMSINNIHIYPLVKTEEIHYSLYKSLVAYATVQKNKDLGYILVVTIPHSEYAMYMQLFTMEQVGIILENNDQQPGEQ